jgi:kynurenine formamidase
VKLVDMTHVFSIHTPGWVGYPSPKLSYFQRFATQGIVSQLLELPLHSGTHLDAEMHIISGGADLASIPIERLCRFYNGAAEEDEERYFLRHPGGDREFAEWLVETELAWTGFDTASGDNPLNTSIRTKWRPEIARQFQDQTGINPDELFPTDDLFVMHKVPFRHGITHLENLGGDRTAVGTRRCPDRRVSDPDRRRRGFAVPRRSVCRGVRPHTPTGRSRATRSCGTYVLT